MRVLIVDDDPGRIKKFFQDLIGAVIDVTDSPETAIAFLSYDRIYLDHRLRLYHFGSEKAPDSETGFAIAQFLANIPNTIPGLNLPLTARPF